MGESINIGRTIVRERRRVGVTQEAATLLESLVRRQDASAPTMLLASAYRKLGRDDEALDLLQAERLRAASFVLSSLMQEVGMRDDAAFALAAGNAAEAVFEALDALVRAADAIRAVPAHPAPSGFPLWDRVGVHLDSAQAGETWAAHKARQADEVASLMRQALVERVASSEWRELAGDDPRYQDVLANALRLRDL